MLIRSEDARDYSDIHELLVSAFSTDQEAMLVRRLRESGRLITSLVAIADGVVAGQIALSPVTIATAGESAIGAGLAPLAVHPRFRRRGIAAHLVRAGLAVCEDSRIGFVVVLGEPNYYGRFGFRKASLYGVENMYGVDEPFLLIQLLPRSVKPGLAHYAPEFAKLSTSTSGVRH